MMVAAAWLVPFTMVSICMRIGDPETLFTSPNQIKTINVIYTNLRLNNEIVRGKVKPYFLAVFSSIILTDSYQ